MQTFLPHTDSFSHIASELDNKRLNKQVLEAWQILLTICELDPQGKSRDPKGWRNHPAVTMWRGHELLLSDYATTLCNEWLGRGFKSTMIPKIESTRDTALAMNIINSSVTYPTWMQQHDKYEMIASTHRVALLRKDYPWYSQFGWPEDPGHRPDYYQYLWPDTNNELYLGTYNNM